MNYMVRYWLKFNCRREFSYKGVNRCIRGINLRLFFFKSGNWMV